MSRKRRDIPVFDQPLIETHCHLDYLKDRPLEETLEKTRDVNIERVITIAVSPENLATVRDLSGRQPWLYGTQGVHPHEAESYSDACEEIIRKHGNDDKIVAIGEIGLDYFYDNADREVQKQVFRRQLQIAADLDQPVVIHSREADEDTVNILSEFEATLNRRGVIHSFTSGPGLARYALDQGWCLGFNGITTFNKAENVRDIVRMAPIEQILLETDSPFLTPAPYRGRENAPFYLPFVAEKIAEVKELELADVLSETYQNSLRTFFPAG
ncbi:TatD family hydrolase [Marinobacter zhanjiangensis]|uniref:LuxR family transcriptional regulator n=1 Tax=Marinobacter zhanjiangensis TaxID=578215 RepID=A0ABQ3B2R4_9GAMM|nr:TatD family hydrolase [Marinobacter zhanjiangensis]GGY71862.1 LuxR family transcriptional regulator [Marinobacter zhanjiangensis]